MEKNIVIFLLSVFNNNAKCEEYNDETGLFKAVCSHTNETGLKYFEWKLAQEGKKIDAVYAIVSKKAKEDALGRFKDLFADRDYPINDVPMIAEDNLSGSFKTISNLFDALQKEKADGSELVIHADMTGGFRHANMLMLALLQMLKYSGTQTGSVIYTNYTNHKVENANDLVAMFTMLGGAEEFAALGNVMQIQKYFAAVPNKSVYLENLLDKMENFTEILKICSHRRNFLKSIQLLAQSLNDYHKFLDKPENKKNLSEQEEFFSKLLPTIEKEYAGILQYANINTLNNIPQIIKWCVKKGFLQQAVTLYTEWVPVFVIDKGIIVIKTNDIKEICRNNAPSWSDWRIYFFKEFKPKHNNRPVFIADTGNEFGYESLRELVEAGMSTDEIINAVKKYKNQNLTKTLVILNEIKDFSINNKDKDYYKLFLAYQALPFGSAVKTLLQKACPANTSMLNFIKKRCNTVKDVEVVLLECIKQISKKEINTIFEFKLADAADNNANSTKRSNVLGYLLTTGELSTEMVKADFVECIDGYMECVDNWRNTFNHAAGIVAGKEDNAAISASIIKRMETLEKYIKN